MEQWKKLLNKITGDEWDGDTAWFAECLPSMHNPLGLIPRTA